MENQGKYQFIHLITLQKFSYQDKLSIYEKLTSLYPNFYIAVKHRQ